ncbi:MAG: hypothetical protein ACPGJS_16740 [Flammeovirgaceae bacterium]
MSPEDLLKASTNILLGMDAARVQVLQKLHIHTVFELATSQLFNNAKQITEAAANENTVLARYQQVGRNMVKNSYAHLTPYQLQQESIEVLDGIGAQNYAEVAQTLDVNSIRELALWPPFRAARYILNEVYATPDTEELKYSEELTPRSGIYASETKSFKKYFRVTPQQITGDWQRDWDEIENNPVELIKSFEHFTIDEPFIGATVEFEQTWTPEGISLGSLSHSLPLAPGESTRIAIVEWQRQQSASLDQSTIQRENLENQLSQQSALDEIYNGTITEDQKGESSTETDTYTYSRAKAGGWTLGFGSSGATTTSGNSNTKSITVSSSEGTKNAVADAQQNLKRSTQQVASSVRSKYASAVKEVKQSETEITRTRIITNYNHSHALSVHYYETVRIYKTRLRAVNASPCLFVPFQFSPLTTLLDKYRERLIPLAKSRLDQDIIAKALGYVKVINLLAPEGQNQETYLAGDGYQFVNVQLIFSSPVKLNKIHAIHQVGEGSRSIHIEESAAPTAVYDFRFDQIVVSNVDGRVDMEYLEALVIEVGDAESLPETVTTVFEIRHAHKADSIVARFNHTLSNASSEGRITLLSFTGNYINHNLYDINDLDKDYYNQAVWMSFTPSEMAQALAGYAWDNEYISGLVDIPPLGTYANCVVFRLNEQANIQAMAHWFQWKAKEFTQLRDEEDHVAVPTGGVFAEAILGRFNASEKIDFTRFWKWSDSPIPDPPGPKINEILLRSRKSSDGLTSPEFDQQIISLVEGDAFPNMAGVQELAGLLQAGNLFRDMSGASQLVTQLQNILGNTTQNAANEANSNKDFQSAQLASSNEFTKFIIEAVLRAAGGEG